MVVSMAPRNVKVFLVLVTSDIQVSLKIQLSSPVKAALLNNHTHHRWLHKEQVVQEGAALCHSHQAAEALFLVGKMIDFGHSLGLS